MEPGDVITVRFTDSDEIRYFPLQLAQEYKNCVFAKHSTERSYLFTNINNYDNMMAVLQGKVSYTTSSEASALLEQCGFIEFPHIIIINHYLAIAEAKIKIAAPLLSGERGYLFCDSDQQYREYKAWLQGVPGIVPIQAITLIDIVAVIYYDNAVPLYDIYKKERKISVKDGKCWRVSPNAEKHSRLVQSWKWDVLEKAGNDELEEPETIKRPPFNGDECDYIKEVFHSLRYPSFKTCSPEMVPATRVCQRNAILATAWLYLNYGSPIYADIEDPQRRWTHERTTTLKKYLGFIRVPPRK